MHCGRSKTLHLVFTVADGDMALMRLISNSGCAPLLCYFGEEKFNSRAADIHEPAG
jgi:hypothetical protein